jgi:hypothetical protein
MSSPPSLGLHAHVMLTLGEMTGRQTSNKAKTKGERTKRQNDKRQKPKTQNGKKVKPHRSIVRL